MEHWESRRPVHGEGFYRFLFVLILSRELYFASTLVTLWLVSPSGGMSERKLNLGRCLDSDDAGDYHQPAEGFGEELPFHVRTGRG
ncbi:hypothetical protein BJX61DRAFT_32087 [Aspergillus egyptiacus]|nr:hypothetical protein BJX61DRAFT_32087 [Aspergillus egyptiacus]